MLVDGLAEQYIMEAAVTLEYLRAQLYIIASDGQHCELWFAERLTTGQCLVVLVLSLVKLILNKVYAEVSGIGVKA
jgi:hypothetical protein